MKTDWIRKASALPARQLHLMGGGLLLVAGAAFWFYGMRAPLAALRTVRAEQAQLALAAGNPQLLAAQLAVLATDTGALAKRLGASSAQPPAQLLVGLVGELGALAREKGVTLHGATPAPEEAALGFTRIGFNAEVTGSYAAVLAWMGAIEQARPNLSIAGFEMRRAKTAGQVDLSIRIAAFLPQENKP